MKYLELPLIIEVNSLLRSIHCGQVRINARIEAFSCKQAGADKTLYWSLEKELSKSPVAQRCSSPPVLLGGRSPSAPVEPSTSPFGPLTEKSSRKIFIYLISTMNHSFPDYDFRKVKADDFKKEVSFQLIMNQINNMLGSVIDGYNVSLRTKLWNALDAELCLKECNIYSYIPDPDSDPFADEGNIWGFNYFFYNAKLKRVALFTCRAVSTAQLRRSSSSSYYDDTIVDDDDEEMYDAGFEMEV